MNSISPYSLSWFVMTHSANIFPNENKIEKVNIKNMRGLTNKMVRDFHETLGYVHEWQAIRERQFLNYAVENLLPNETEIELLNTVVIQLLELYTYTDMKESITSFRLKMSV